MTPGTGEWAWLCVCAVHYKPDNDKWGRSDFSDIPGKNVYYFRSDGSITFSASVLVDVLVVGGGGAGGSAIGGGGGAGAVIFASDVLLPGNGGSYTITVGSGVHLGVTIMLEFLEGPVRLDLHLSRLVVEVGGLVL